MNLEDDLRVTLHDRAAEAEPQPDLWHEVRTGVHRARRRRVVLAAGTTAVAIAAAVSVPMVLADRSGGSPPIPADSAPAASAPAIDWVWPSWPEPVFPLRPGWVPGGVGEPEVLVMGANTLLHYENDASIVEVETGPLAPSWETEGTEEHTADVGGREATVRTAPVAPGGPAGQEFVGVRWRSAAGAWVQVLSWGPRDEAEVLKFARFLGAGSVPAGPASIEVTAVPAGLTLQHRSKDNLCVAAPEVVAAEREPEGLCATVVDEDYAPEAEAEPVAVTVGDREASFYADSGRIDVNLGAGRTLNVMWDPETMPLSRTDALRFAEGVTIRP
ncbi:hypothetical protein [Actinoplanes sp. DH11]|uniref:hypothetical protein n=1 Tax=Actinoplanes sp. DH11 TaxID=2857011 RepID=UPI001E606927|nr:hypothetical protein [Actinoplanes sp. DH11]